MFLDGAYLNKIYHVQRFRVKVTLKKVFQFTMELCNYHILGPVFSHAADAFNYTVFKLRDPWFGICAGKSVLICLFINYAF